MSQIKCYVYNKELLNKVNHWKNQWNVNFKWMKSNFLLKKSELTQSSDLTEVTFNYF